MNNADDLPIFRPHFGSGRRAPENRGGASLRNAVLARSRTHSALAGARPSHTRMRAAIAAPSAGSRRVVVKAHVVRMTRSGAKAAALHLKYIQRDGVEKDGSAGFLYSRDGAADERDFTAPEPNERHQFRFIIAPEDGDQLDMTDFVRRTMDRVEKDLGRKLEWAAVNHHDTDHPHAHVVVRGVDRDGQQVRFDRAYISHGLRLRAQELATRELGERTPWERARALEKEMSQARFTSLDRELARRVVDGRVDVRVPGEEPPRNASLLIGRLEHLEKMRLAERVAPSSWKLADGWQTELRDLGERGDILKQIHKALGRDAARCKVVRRGEAITTTNDATIAGRLVGKGLSDELKGTYYAIVRTDEGRAFHVPVDRRSFERARVGESVSLSRTDAGRAFAMRRPEVTKQGPSHELKRPDGPWRGR